VVKENNNSGRKVARGDSDKEGQNFIAGGGKKKQGALSPDMRRRRNALNNYLKRKTKKTKADLITPQEGGPKGKCRPVRIFSKLKAVRESGLARAFASGEKNKLASGTDKKYGEFLHEGRGRMGEKKKQGNGQRTWLR